MPKRLELFWLAVLCLWLLDLDGLKQLNDTQGHAAGDEAIVSVARTCQSALQGRDPDTRRDGDDLGHASGHVAGEGAIATVASTCESTLRGTDLVARWGGDEFAVLLPAATGSDAEIVARRLRAAIQSQVVAGQHLRVSVGIAAAAAARVSVSELLASADADLYRDKRQRKAASSRQAA